MFKCELNFGYQFRKNKPCKRLRNCYVLALRLFFVVIQRKCGRIKHLISRGCNVSPMVSHGKEVSFIIPNYMEKIIHNHIKTLMNNKHCWGNYLKLVLVWTLFNVHSDKHSQSFFPLKKILFSVGQSLQVSNIL